ncbi:unnamed protein product [Leuciscus chuanchicus]
MVNNSINNKEAIIGVAFYEMLQAVDQHIKHLSYMDPICDFLYHIKYMFTGDSVKDQVERIICSLRPAMRLRLRFITHISKMEPVPTASSVSQTPSVSSPAAPSGAGPSSAPLSVSHLSPSSLLQRKYQALFLKLESLGHASNDITAAVTMVTADPDRVCFRAQFHWSHANLRDH